ncbi:MAG: ParA family protein [Sphaerochaeta sp.]|jgi:chromosome partitioning protein|uniref:ParA family protein n=1 Tax=Sphaerochaeta sp. TaxID=1972642 RepID=UPI002FCA9121
MNAHTILFLNQKGGVGKTTSAVNLGSALAQKGKKVLLIDLDSQGNLTSATSIDGRKSGIYEVIAGQCSIAEAVQQTPVRNLYAIASNINMAGLNIELVEQDKREFFLKEALAGLDKEWDFVLADCPPSLGLVTVNAMVWAKEVIIPMQCEYFAMEGLNLLMRTVGNMKKSLNPDLEVLGILFTMFSKRTKLAQEVVEDISSFFPNLVFSTIIPRTIRIAEAPSHGLPINVYDASSSGTKAYKALAEEVLDRVSGNH